MVFVLRDLRAEDERTRSKRGRVARGPAGSEDPGTA